MTEPLIALYDDPDAAQCAVGRLHEHGVDDVRVTSPAPYPVAEEHYRPLGWRQLGWLALGGGLLGLVSAIAITGFGSLAEPLCVGSKPVLAWPAFSVVMFEMTMLGAGLTNFLAVILFFAVARRGVAKKARQAAVDGHLALVVPLAARSAERTAEIREALHDALEVTP